MYPPMELLLRHVVQFFRLDPASVCHLGLKLKIPA